MTTVSHPQANMRMIQVFVDGYDDQALLTAIGNIANELDEHDLLIGINLSVDESQGPSRASRVATIIIERDET